MIILRIIFILFSFFQMGFALAEEHEEESMLPIHEYYNEPSATAEDTIIYRAEVDPLNIISTIIFALAVIHILFSRKIRLYALALEKRNHGKYFLSETVKLFSEVEIIFGLWAVPLILAITFLYGWDTAQDYLDSRNYVEAMAVVIVMTIASTYPIIFTVEKGIQFLAKKLGSTPGAWWLVLLTVGPLLGSFITEAGAMIVTSMLLVRQFFCRPVSEQLAYATIGLLFTHVSLGGILTTYASPPALMVATKWGWGTFYMMTTFGWKSILTILVSNLIAFHYFRNEFAALNKIPKNAFKKNIPEEEIVHHHIPPWVVAGNLFFLILVVLNLHAPVVCIGIFLFFLGFHQASQRYQTALKLRPALLVGFFIAGLVIHAGLQEWWIAPLFDHANAHMMMGISLFLAPFTDNAALVYMASLIPDLSLSSKYAVMVGAVAGGGLTVIANAPNPAGWQILSPHFAGGISSRNLFLGALMPTIVAILIFYIFHFWL